MRFSIYRTWKLLIDQKILVYCLRGNAIHYLNQTKYKVGLARVESLFLFSPGIRFTILDFEHAKQKTRSDLPKLDCLYDSIIKQS